MVVSINGGDANDFFFFNIMCSNGLHGCNRRLAMALEFVKENMRVNSEKGDHSLL